jgi:hypothetical protein
MKTCLSAVILFVVIGSAYRTAEAQPYGPYYNGPYGDLQYQHYLQWQQYLAYLQQVDPYYELHVMHYQLYRQPYQPYFLYPPCCYARSYIPPHRGLHVRRPPVTPIPRSTRKR